jgi:hypothetical protein
MLSRRSTNDAARLRLTLSPDDSAALRALVPGPYPSRMTDRVSRSHPDREVAPWRGFLSALRRLGSKAPADSPDAPSPPEWRTLDASAPSPGPVAVAGFHSRLLCLWPTGALQAFDPALEEWIPRAAAPIAFLSVPAVAMVGDQLHALGFRRTREGERAIHLGYDPEADYWTELPPAPTSRDGFAVAATAEALVVAGGRGQKDGRPLAVVEAYDPARKRWSTLPALPRAVAFAAATSADGAIQVLGGVERRAFGLGEKTSRAVQVYTPKTGGWSLAGPLPVARRGARATSEGDRLFLVGGSLANGQLAPIQAFDAATSLWSDIAAPPRRRHDPGALAIDGALYLVGGRIGATPAASIETRRIDDRHAAADARRQASSRSA